MTMTFSKAYSWFTAFASSTWCYYRYLLLLMLLATVHGQQQPQNSSQLLANLTYAHLLQLTKDAHGNPNPRVTCTSGYEDAVTYVEQVMADLGMIPLGDVNRTTYRNVVPGSVHSIYCPHGMVNLIGMVPGGGSSTNDGGGGGADEYILYMAHLDGPNNGNPQTSKTRGNGNTTNAYDDATAVALGLAMAELMLSSSSSSFNNLPGRNVIFMFDDGEEGWDNVGIPQLGLYEYGVDICQNMWQYTDYFQTMPINTILGQPCNDTGNTKVHICCDGTFYEIGAAAWVQNPTVDLSQIRAAFVADPLGSPPGSDALLVAIGGEKSIIVSSSSENVNANNNNTGSTMLNMNDYLNSIYPSNASKALLKAPVRAIRGYASSMMSLTREYPKVCAAANNCMLEGFGVPSVWLAQPAFQKYHGGYAIDTAKGLFQQLGFTDFLPSTAYFSVDDMSALNRDALQSLGEAIYGLLLNAAKSDVILTYSSDYGSMYSQQDLVNLNDIVSALESSLLLLPKNFSQTVGDIIGEYKKALLQLSSQNLTDPIVQESIQPLAMAVVGFAISIDFFQTLYPTKEAFADQTVEATASEAMPTQSPTPLKMTTPAGGSASGSKAASAPSVVASMLLPLSSMTFLLLGMVTTPTTCILF